MSELLSNTKKKYIENWRQSVCQHMESGTICRVTISEMTPEPGGYITSYIKPSKEHEKAMATRSSQPSSENVSPSHLPTVKFGYSHGNDELKKKHKQRNTKPDISRTILPPSPNGMLVQNGGGDKPTTLDRKSNTLRTIDNNIHYNKEQDKPDSKETNADETEDRPRRSSQIAKEIYERYNMQSRSNTLTSMSQFTMPWRNKTFLTLPVRFNDSARRKHIKQLAREKTSMSSRKETLSSSVLTNESRIKFYDWDEEKGL